jgi:hypothetical protein
MWTPTEQRLQLPTVHKGTLAVHCHERKRGVQVRRSRNPQNPRQADPNPLNTDRGDGRLRQSGVEK